MKLSRLIACLVLVGGSLGCLSEKVSDYHLGNSGSYVWTELDDANQREETLATARENGIEEVCIPNDPLFDGREGCYQTCNLEGQHLECSIARDELRLGERDIFRLKLSSRSSSDQIYSPYLSKNWLAHGECARDYIPEEFFIFRWNGEYVRDFLTIEGRFRICDAWFLQLGEEGLVFDFVDASGNSLIPTAFSCTIKELQGSDGYFSCRLTMQPGIRRVRMKVSANYLIVRQQRKQTTLVSSEINLADHVPEEALIPAVAANPAPVPPQDPAPAAGPLSEDPDEESGAEDEADGAEEGRGNPDASVPLNADKKASAGAVAPAVAVSSGIKGGGACGFSIAGFDEALKTGWLGLLAVLAFYLGLRRIIGNKTVQ